MSEEYEKWFYHDPHHLLWIYPIVMAFVSSVAVEHWNFPPRTGSRLVDELASSRDRAADSGDRIPTTVVPEVVVVAVPEMRAIGGVVWSRWAPQHRSRRAKDARRVESVLPPTGGTLDACGLKTFNRRLDARPPTLERLGGQFEGGEAGIGGSFVVVESVIDRPRPRRSPGVPPDPDGHLWKPHPGDAMRLRPRTLVRLRGLPTSNRSPRGTYPIWTEAHGFEFRG